MIGTLAPLTSIVFLFSTMEVSGGKQLCPSKYLPCVQKETHTGLQQLEEE